MYENIKKKVNGKWYVYSHDGKKKLGGPYDTEGEADKRLKEIEYFKKHPKNVLHEIKLNVDTKIIRNDTLNGKSYIVAPAVMLVEGVHEGSEGPYLYTAEELSKRPHLWNMKPVVVYHPDSPTACTKEVIESRGIGHLMNTQWDENLKTEAWIDPDRLAAVEEKMKTNKISEAIEKKEMLELSTGLFADSDEIPGEWGEGKEKYNGTLSNYGPDHLAVLPDQKGACSIADGAGFIRNAQGREIQLSKSWVQYFENLGINSLKQQLQTLVHKDKEYRWIEDVDTDAKTFVFSDEKGGMYQQGYKVDADVATLNGSAEEVVRVVSYKTKTMKLSAHERKDNMDKKQKVDALIANKSTQWEEADREYLNGLDEAILDKMNPKEIETPAPEKTDEKTPVQNAEPETPMSDEEWLSKLPPKVQQMHRNTLKREEAYRNKLIDKILSYKVGDKPKFNRDFLNRQQSEDLEALAEMVGVVAKNDRDEDDPPMFNDYSGQADVVNDDGPCTIVLNTPKWEDDKKEAKTA